MSGTTIQRFKIVLLFIKLRRQAFSNLILSSADDAFSAASVPCVLRSRADDVQGNYLPLLLKLTIYHRQSYGTCRLGTSDESGARERHVVNNGGDVGCGIDRRRGCADWYDDSLVPIGRLTFVALHESNQTRDVIESVCVVGAAIRSQIRRTIVVDLLIFKESIQTIFGKEQQLRGRLQGILAGRLAVDALQHQSGTADAVIGMVATQNLVNGECHFGKDAGRSFQIGATVIRD